MYCGIVVFILLKPPVAAHPTTLIMAVYMLVDLKTSNFQLIIGVARSR
jgi:hypothetical protein